MTTHGQKVARGLRLAREERKQTPAPAPDPFANQIEQLRLALSINTANLRAARSPHTRELIARAIERDRALLRNLTR